MRRARAALAIAPAFVLFAACGAPEQGTAEVRLRDRASFESAVQPVLAARCASPECHGRPERPFSTYAPLRFRADPARTHVDEPLDAAELLHNYVASNLFAEAGDPAEAPALTRKPLAERAGVFHGGGVVFDDPSDPDYAALAAWVAR